MNEILKERFWKLENELELADAEVTKLRAELDAAKADNARLAADAEWGRTIWDYLRNMLQDSGTWIELDTEDLMLIAEKHGRAKKVRFDPEIHGFIDAEPGDDIWWWGNDIQDRSKFMHDLLAPTIELLERVRPIMTYPYFGKEIEATEKELTRLRALCGEGKQVDK